MKRIISILFIILFINGYSQVRVPDTETFSLQDVWNAVKDHTSGTTGDLSDCFANAFSNYFDPTYNNDSYAPANSMKRFRNYGKGNPTIGTYPIPFPDYDGERVIGRLIYVSPDGGNLFIFVTVERYQAYTNWLVRFTMQGFDLSTLAFHSQRVFMTTPDQTYKEHTMRFSDDGTRLMFLYDYHLPHSGNPIIYTYILDDAWDIVSSFQDFAETTLVEYNPGGLGYADRMDFSEDGYSIVLLHRSYLNQTLEFFTLSQKQNLPSGTINASASSAYINSGMANEVVGFNMFEDSFVPGISELAIINPSGQLSVGNVRVDSNPYYAAYPYSEDYVPYAFVAYRYADVYTTANREYTYILEFNPDVSDPIYPRVYLRVNN